MLGVSVVVKRPSRQEFTRIAEDLRFGLSAEEVASYAAVADTVLDSHARLDELADTRLEPTCPRRDPGRFPSSEENPHHGWVWRCSVSEADHGPLAGQRVAIKDNIAMAGLPMLNGSPVMEGFVPREEATVVTRVLEAGAEIVGKTAVPGLCWDGTGVTCYPEPQPSNPYDATRLPGASSAGNGVVLATGQADLALGSDQGGSIRLPASWSGCCGLKPTHGLVPYTGAFPIESTVDHLGPMACTVADCARMLDVIGGSDGLDPRQYGVEAERCSDTLEYGLDGLRIGVLREGFAIPDVSEPDVDATVRTAAETLARGGAQVEDLSVPMHRDGFAIWTAIALEGTAEMLVRGDAVGTNWRGHYSTDLADFYGRARRAYGHDLSPTVTLTGLLGTYLSERYNHHYYAKAHNVGRQLRQHYADALNQVDLLLLPTAPMKPLPRPHQPGIADTVATALANLHNTTPSDVTGNPALSVPCGLSDGLPVGAMLLGRHGDDATVLRAGHAYEQLRDPVPSPTS